jgi:exopolyphosphatase / guanosine-5'-triphosphate,3'-diphosphate pyrophosphatase
MQKLAVIDCGTNTFHLLVVTADDANISTVYRKQFAVKLGEGGINQNTIQPAAFQRGLDALKFFAEKIKELAVDKVAAFATSATRSAINGALFVDTVYNQTGIALQTIDGMREAELIYNGVKRAYPLGDENILTMDIGGGSVEFIIGNKNTIHWYASFEVGAARLVEMFHKTEPIAPADVDALNKYLSEKLAPLAQAMQQYPVTKLVGSAGSFDSICELINEHFGLHLLQHGETWCNMDIDHYKQIHQKLLLSTIEDRKQMAGLVDYRVEMMVVASCLINYVLSSNNLSGLFCATYSLKEGVMFEMLGQ